MTRWRELEASSFTSAQIHGNLVPFSKNLPERKKERAASMVARHLASIADQLGDRPFLLESA